MEEREDQYNDTLCFKYTDFTLEEGHFFGINTCMRNRSCAVMPL